MTVVAGTVDNGDDGFVEAGDTIEYEMEISNTGNTCLEDVVVQHLSLGGDNECEVHDTGTARNRSGGVW